MAQRKAIFELTLYYNSEEGTFYSGYDAKYIEPLSAGDEIQFELGIPKKALSVSLSVELET